MLNILCMVRYCRNRNMCFVAIALLVCQLWDIFSAVGVQAPFFRFIPVVVLLFAAIGVIIVLNIRGIMRLDRLPPEYAQESRVPAEAPSPRLTQAETPFPPQRKRPSSETDPKNAEAKAKD